MGRGAVAERRDAHRVGAAAQLVLVVEASDGADAVNAIAVLIARRVSRVAAGVGGAVAVVAVLSAPVGAAEGGDRREAVAVIVLEGEVVGDAADAGDNSANVEGAEVVDGVLNLEGGGHRLHLSLVLRDRHGAARGEEAADGGVGLARAHRVADLVGGVAALEVLVDGGADEGERDVAHVFDASRHVAADGGEGVGGGLLLDLHRLRREGHHERARRALGAAIDGLGVRLEVGAEDSVDDFVGEAVRRGGDGHHHKEGDDEVLHCFCFFFWCYIVSFDKRMRGVRRRTVKEVWRVGSEDWSEMPARGRFFEKDVAFIKKKKIRIIAGGKINK